MASQPTHERTIALSPEEAIAAREKRVVALSSIGAAVVLTGMKLAVGLLTGSLGLLAEAAHSALDMVAAIITFFAVRASARPPDSDHLYGHGKVENLSALIETLLLLLTCAWIVYEGVQRLLFKDVHVDATIWAFVVVGLSIVIDISRSRALRHVAKKHNSQALEADALHFSTDVWSSGVVLLGLILVRIGENTAYAQTFLRADAVAALVVAVLVVYVSVRLGWRTIDALLDRAPPGLSGTLDAAVRAVDGVLDCRQVRLRESGDRTFVDLVIAVRRGLTVERSHAITQAVEECIHALLPKVDVVVHVDPMQATDETLPERIRAIAANIGQTAHNILVSEEGGGIHVELHVETDADRELRDAHAEAESLEAAIRAELPEIAEVTTHIEPYRGAPASRSDVTESSQAIIAKVQRIVAGLRGIVDCHDVTVRRADADVFLTMHCTFAPGLSVREVHDLSTKLEERLRAAIPHLVRVTTHPEPLGEEHK